MKSFTTKFRVDNMDVGVIVIPVVDDKEFKVEMFTDDPNPVILTRSDNNLWKVKNPGKWTISNEDFQKLGQIIDARLNKIYSMETILVLTDFSDAAFTAARYAGALTHQLDTSCLILYHSYESIPAATDIPVPSTGIDFHKESVKHLDDLKNDLKPFVNKKTTIETRADERPLVSAVESITEQQRAGLVVMGVTGEYNLEQILIGSNTVTIAKECLVPVLAVPKEAEFENIRRVLFACDLKEVLTTPVHTIKALIHSLNAKLVILNVDRNKQQNNQDITSEQSLLRRLWDDENPEYHFINNKDIAAGIMEFADKHDIQLVITVPKKYGFFESLFHRSLTKKLAFHTHTPLLILEEDI